jgi:hypothetical protein
MEQKQLTDSEKLDILSRRMRRMEVSTNIQTVIMVVGFLGIVSLSSLVVKLKQRINGN